MGDFNKQKIIWGEISDKPKFAYDMNGEYYLEATTFMMTGKNLGYLLAILNSSLSAYFFSKLGTTTGVGTLRWKKFKLEEFAVPLVEKVDTKIIKSLNQAISNPTVNPKQIDSLVYQIYDLSESEVSFLSDFSDRYSNSSGDN